MAKHIITIARMYGSGGRLLARTLSKELGIHYYDKELLTLVSVEHGVNMSIVSDADEKHDEGFFKRFVPGQIASPSSRDYLSKSNIFNMTADVIRGIADKDESCVIVGRCANHVLKGRDDVISIFVHADYDHLVQFAMGYDGISPEERRKFTDTVFGLLESTGAKTVGDLSLGDPVAFAAKAAAMIRQYASLDKDAKDNVYLLMRRLAEANFKAR